MWSDTLLRLTPEQELQMACTDTFTLGARRAAYERYEVKRWYERVVLAAQCKLDFPDLDPQLAAELSHLRTLIGVNAPWILKGQLAA